MEIMIEELHLKNSTFSFTPSSNIDVNKPELIAPDNEKSIELKSSTTNSMLEFTYNENIEKSVLYTGDDYINLRHDY